VHVLLYQASIRPVIAEASFSHDSQFGCRRVRAVCLVDQNGLDHRVVDPGGRRLVRQVGVLGLRSRGAANGRPAPLVLARPLYTSTRQATARPDPSTSNSRSSRNHILRGCPHGLISR
jgi:hypothetical protein